MSCLLSPSGIAESSLQFIIHVGICRQVVIVLQRSPLDVVVGDHIESQASDTVLNLSRDGNPPLYSG